MMGKIFTAAACCLLFLLAGIEAGATPPFAPVDLAVTVSVDDATSAYSAVFTWGRPRGAGGVNWPVDGYRLYARDLTQDGSDYIEIGSTVGATSTTLTITDEVSLCCGAYTYYVKAYNGDGTGDASNLVSTVGGRNYNEGDFGGYAGTGRSEIVSAPPAKARLDAEYRYDAMVLDDLHGRAGDVTFTLAQGPSGMTIDAATGLVRWTPSEPGLYNVRIDASIEATQETHQQIWTVEAGKSAAGVPFAIHRAGSIYPNPASAGITVRLDAGGSASLLRVSDLRGRIVLDASAPAGAESYRLDVSSLAPGTYFLHLSGMAGERVLPFNIVR